MNEKSNVTIGDVWEEITKKGKTRSRTLDTDAIYMRFAKQKSGSLKMTLHIGKEICEMFQWVPGDSLMMMRNKLNGTLLKLSKSSFNGYKLVTPNKNAGKFFTSCSIDFHKKYILDQTLPVNFTIDKNNLVIDIASLIKE